jgi:phage shock protein A
MIRRNISQATKDADHFHQLALQYRTAGNEDLAEKAFSAEKACRENVSELERELLERSKL